MRRVLPCPTCPDGVAKLRKADGEYEPYIMGRLPGAFRSPGHLFVYTCMRCQKKHEASGKMIGPGLKLTRTEFMSIPDLDLTREKTAAEIETHIEAHRHDLEARAQLKRENAAAAKKPKPRR